MNILFLTFSLALLWLHLASVTVTLGRWLPFPLARSAGLLGIALVMCVIEHGVGLGAIGWAWPLTTLAAAGAVYVHREQLRSREFWWSERVLLAAVGFGLAWKWVFPSIFPTNERYTDLYFMLNYFPGDTLPPTDIWFPPLKFNFYYAFQHYAAALMGRLFNWDPGITYNIAFSLLMGLGVTLMWDFIGRFVHQHWKKWLLLLAVASGGTGISAVYPLLNDGDNRDPASIAGDEVFANARFIGFFDQRVNTELGRALFPLPKVSDPPFEPRIIAMENFGYQYAMSDYHPPVGGFFLLFLGLAALAWAELPARTEGGGSETRRQRLGQGLFALTVPVVLITNAWVFPMAVLLLGTWVAWRVLRREPPDWHAVIGGGLLGMMLIYPVLNGLAAEGLATPIRWVQPQDHTSPWRFIAYFWPLLVVIALSLFERRARPIALMFGLAFGLATLAGEFIYVDDFGSEALRRYNTTAKWYGWIWSGALLACGAAALSSTKRWMQAIAAISLLLVSTYALPMASYLWHVPKYDVGFFNGLPGEMRDPPIRQMLRYLKQSPRGIVTESAPGNGYTSQTMVAMFSGQIAMQGWPILIGNWRRHPPGMWETYNETMAFYRSDLPDRLGWLRRNQVRYVAWVGRDNQWPEAWNAINQAIGSEYSWKPFQENAGSKIGLWIKNAP